MSDKQLAMETIEQLPDSATLVDIARRLEFVAAVRDGLQQIEQGDIVSHEEVKRDLGQWLTK